MLVKVANMADANRIINHPKVLDELKCKASLSVPQAANRGLIRGVPLDFTEEEIREEILGNAANVPVTKAVRVCYKDENKQMQPSMSVILEFQGTVLPRRIYFSDVSRQVELYVNKPRVCYKCQQFGHIAKECKSRKFYCRNCAEAHDSRQCTKTDTQLCINCGGAHSPHSLDCPIMQRKFSERLELALKDCKFQPRPNIRSTEEFPQHLATHQEETTPPETEMTEKKARPLPKKVQRNKVRQFSEVLAARNRPDDLQIELRKQRYKAQHKSAPEQVAKGPERLKVLETQRKSRNRSRLENTDEHEYIVRASQESEQPEQKVQQQVDIDNLSHCQLQKVLSSDKVISLLVMTVGLVMSIVSANPSGAHKDLVTKVKAALCDAFAVDQSIEHHEQEQQPGTQEPNRNQDNEIEDNMEDEDA